MTHEMRNWRNNKENWT